MKIGVTLRNMGSQSSPELLAQCARTAEAAGLESIWVVDHMAIPPDDAEGSDGRYLDILSTLAWLAGVTEHIHLGASVLILPYRAILPTVKQIATIQELSQGRLIMGMGIGWMEAEFKALGIPRHERGRRSDDALAFFNACFEQDEVSLNGQTFLFRPRPKKPPFFIGGRAPHALIRAAKYGDGWQPISRNPKNLVASIEQYRGLTDAAGKPPGQVNVNARLPLEDPAQAKEMLATYRDMGVDRLVTGVPYNDLSEFRRGLERLLTFAGV